MYQILDKKSYSLPLLRIVASQVPLKSVGPSTIYTLKISLSLKIKIVPKPCSNHSPSIGSKLLPSNNFIAWSFEVGPSTLLDQNSSE